MGKLIHLMKWSCPEFSYAVRELSKYMKMVNRSHVLAMHCLFHHVLATKERGLVIEPSESWDGILAFLFEITGMSDANFAAHVEDRMSVSGLTWSVFLNSAPVWEKSQQQNCVTLSVTEAELIAVCECAQDMIQIKQILTSLGLKVKISMKLYVDSCGVVDLVNKWSVCLHTHHVDV